MDYLNHNLQCLKKIREKLYEKIIEIIEKKDYNYEKFKLVDTKNGQKTIEIKAQNNVVRLNSLYDPQKEAKIWAKQNNFNNFDSSVQMFGIANGIFVREMLANLQKDSLVYLVEPDLSLFMFCLSNFDLSDIISDERVALFIKDINFNEYYKVLLKGISDRMLFTQIVCSHPYIEKLYHNEAIEFCDAIKKRIKKGDINYSTMSDLGRHSVDNIIKNLHFIKNSIYVGDLKDKIPKDVPIIIVAAGPSLDKNINELKKAEGRAFIIAVDRAVGSLIEHNINFSAIITVDPSKEIELLNDSRCLDYYMFACLDSRNEILELNHFNKIWLNSASLLYAICSKNDIKVRYYSIGGSVATAAFNVARILEMKKIILVGQDLAYDGDVTHVGGKNDNAYRQTEFVEGIYGNKVKTRSDWAKYLDWYNMVIKELPNDVEVIDATEGGAKIEGTKVMKLSKAVAMYCKKEFNFESLIKNVPATFSGKKYLEVKCDLLHLEKEIKDIQICAERGIKAADSLLNMSRENISDEKKENEYAETIKSMNDIIEQQMIYSTLSLYITKDTEPVMRGVNFNSSDNKRNLEETCLMSKFLYNKILEATKELAPKLSQSLNRLKQDDN